MKVALPSTIFIAMSPIDLRLSFDRLAGIVREQLADDPRGESIFVFHNKRRTHLKLLWSDGTGYCILYKRLDPRRSFRIPMAVPGDTSRVRVSERELRILFRGIDLSCIRAARRTARRVMAA